MASKQDLSGDQTTAIHAVCVSRDDTPTAMCITLHHLQYVSHAGGGGLEDVIDDRKVKVAGEAIGQEPSRLCSRSLVACALLQWGRVQL